MNEWIGIGRRALPMVLFTIAPFHLSRAQDSDPFARADASLTASYKQALVLYPRSSQETLRKAERAWIAFSNKNEALLDSLRNDGLISQDADDAGQLSEVNARATNLRVLFCNSGIPYDNPQDALRVQEQRMGAAYMACYRRFVGRDRDLLREAELVWIAYRDLNTNAVALALHQPSNTPAWTASARANLDSCHADELSSLVTAMNAAPNLPAPTEAQTGSFDDRADVASWQTNAKATLNKIIGKKDAAFFGPVTGLKNPPPLPGDEEAKITSTWETLRTLRNNEIARTHSVTSDALYLTSGEAATISVLQAWIAFKSLLKSGNLHDADLILSDTLKQKPNPLPPQYASIWDKLGEWKTAADQTEAQIQDHVRKAKASADLGKSADAISELQAAYSLFEDPHIAEAIKKIRDESLGL